MDTDTKTWMAAKGSVLTEAPDEDNNEEGEEPEDEEVEAAKPLPTLSEDVAKQMVFYKPADAQTCFVAKRASKEEIVDVLTNNELDVFVGDTLEEVINSIKGQSLRPRNPSPA